MRTVIYDAADMEPITVIDVPQHFIREIETGRRPPSLCFAVVPAIRAADFDPDRPMNEAAVNYYVRVRFEPIFKEGRRMMWLCTTQDGETALRMKAAFLPGQQGEVNRIEERAFLRGLFAAMGA